ncbi:MAG: TonB-dependent receptor [Lewinellaceae bacterium]|nr:TonB-dependent receptor [Lewinellaceae bacterium]
MKITLTLMLSLCSVLLWAQKSSINGRLTDAQGQALVYANIALFQTADSSLVKVENSNDNGDFMLRELRAGNYYLKATYLGLEDLFLPDLVLGENQALNLGALRLNPGSLQLTEAVVTAKRSMVEVKPDRTVFNVEGTINSVGSDGLALLRKAPGVTVDNNDNINVLGRSGVLVYVDGKRLPLSGQDLSNYLQSLSAEQIDRIDIITSPGAKYEAEGNAGILDIRLKKDKNLGANGTLNGSFAQGRYHRSTLGGSGNYRNKHFNAFGSGSLGNNDNYNDMTFLSYQNGLIQDEINNSTNKRVFNDYRIGTDFFLAPKHTLGILASGNSTDGDRDSYNRITLAQQSTPLQYDSILVANSNQDYRTRQQAYNLNYRFDNGKDRTLNMDADYAQYRNASQRYQPNRYYDASEQNLLTEIINSFDTPTDIDIYTFKLDYEDKFLGGKLGVGTKISQVISDNTFLFNDVINGQTLQNDSLSNTFRYDEKVYAAYLNYARPIGKTLNFSAGLRTEKTDATGDLKAFRPELQEDPVVLDYLSWFPSAGLSWQAAEQHMLSLNYGRRINRPDYDVLNPFNNQISQLSYSKGNPFLRPEIVNNLELGYTYAYQYNFKLAYSLTNDQITRLIAPDENDPRAGFITWANLATQKVWSFNASVPVQVSKKWNAYFNASASYINNQAKYENGSVVDVQVFSYSIYQQQTFDLPYKLTAEVSGYYSGPGVWGGVFRYESNWGLDLGLQRKFLQDRLNAKISVSDLFYQTGWDGYSDFGGLLSYGGGRWDSRRVAINLSYRFGNDQVKSRKRNTGIEAETGRLGN